MNKKIETVIFTNEVYSDILNVTLPRIIKHLKPINIRINVVSNKSIDNIDLSDANFINTDTIFSPSGNHFRDSMIKALEFIDSEYILFFCDDYMINSDINTDNFHNVMKIIEHYNCDFFSFSSLNYCDHIISKWNKINTDLSQFNIGGGILYEIPNNYRHLYSVQPCIWKKSSLIDILTYNEGLSIGSLDNTNIKNKKGNLRNLNHETNYYDETDETAYDYGFINLTINYPPFSYNIDDRTIGSDFFVFDYGEILRHGKIMYSDTNSKKILMSFLEKNEHIKQKILKFFL